MSGRQPRFEVNRSAIKVGSNLEAPFPWLKRASFFQTKDPGFANPLAIVLPTVLPGHPVSELCPADRQIWLRRYHNIVPTSQCFLRRVALEKSCSRDLVGARAVAVSTTLANAISELDL
jgi:hypothetical protein